MIASFQKQYKKRFFSLIKGSPERDIQKKMDWFRTAIGLKASFPEERNPVPDERREEKQASLLKAQKMQLKQLKAHLEEVGIELEAALEQGNKTEARSKLQQQRQLQSDVRLLEGKIQNQEIAQRTITQADSNREQALLMKDGATKLNAIVEDTEKIDLDDIVDTYQDGAARTHEFSTRLSEPLFSSSYLNDDGQDVDEELDTLMQRTADRQTAGLTGIVAPKIIPSVKPHPSLQHANTQQKSEGVVKRSNTNPVKEGDL